MEKWTLFGFHIEKGKARNVNIENGPQTGPVFWTPKRGPLFGEIVRAFAAAFLRHAPGLFEYEILCRPTFLIWLMVC